MDTRRTHKSLAALVLGAFTSVPALAQDSVQVWGIVDLGLARNIGSDAWTVQNGAASRLGFRGQEDLGGGTKAFFDLENRFLGDTGAMEGCVFWCRHSVVGISGSFGRLTLGREDTPILKTAVHADPWWYDTVAGSFNGQTLSANDSLWVNKAVTYSVDFGPLNVTAQVATKEGNRDPFMAAGTADRSPKGGRVTYASGPLFASAAYWDSGVGEGKITAASVKYDFGVVKPYLGLVQGKDGKGHVAQDHQLRNVIVGLAAPLGGGTLNVSYDRYSDRAASKTLSSKFGMGYFYDLSKRTTIYSDLAHDSESPTHRWGFDIGIQHRF